MFTRPAIIRRKCTDSDEVWSVPSILFGAGHDRSWERSAQKRERESGQKFCFFCEVNNAWLCPFPVSQISRNLHTRRGSVSPWILSENIFENLPVRGLFPKRQLFWRPSSTTSDFSPRYFRNDYKSRKVMTGCQPTECWLSICTLGINSRSFPWLAGCVQKVYFQMRRDA